MDYILGVFPQLGYVVKKVSKRLYRLVKFKKTAATQSCTVFLYFHVEGQAAAPH